MVQTTNRFFDEVARLMNDAAGVAQGVRREFETLFRNQADRFLRDLDVVKREEFEAVKEMARLATRGPRSGCRAGASSNARPASSAAVPGSVVPRASAACSKVAMAVSSPGSALSASCWATSTGSAPLARSTSAA